MQHILDAFIEKLRLIFLITLSSAASSCSIRKTKIARGIAFCPSTITDTAVSSSLWDICRIWRGYNEKRKMSLHSTPFWQKDIFWHLLHVSRSENIFPCVNRREIIYNNICWNNVLWSLWGQISSINNFNNSQRVLAILSMAFFVFCFWIALLFFHLDTLDTASFVVEVERHSRCFFYCWDVLSE